MDGIQYIFFNLQNHPTFLSEERFVNLARGRECFVGLSILLVYVVRRLVGRLLAREDSQARRVINPASLINLATRQEDEANKKTTCCK